MLVCIIRHDVATSKIAYNYFYCMKLYIQTSIINEQKVAISGEPFIERRWINRKRANVIGSKLTVKSKKKQERKLNDRVEIFEVKQSRKYV